MNKVPEVEYDALSPPVQRALTTLTLVLGDTFPFADLIVFVEASRSKSLRIEEESMPIGVAGYCVSLQDVDLICTRVGLDPILQCATRLHEIAHLILRHVPDAVNSPNTLSYADFCQRRNLRHAISRNHVTAYDTPQERDAEVLGTYLFQRILHHEATIPVIAQHLHG